MISLGSGAKIVMSPSELMPKEERDENGSQNEE